MSAITVTVVGNLGKDVERKGTSENAPYRTSIAASNSVAGLDKKRTKPLFKPVVIWKGTDAYRMIEAMSNKGMNLKKGDNLIIMGTLRGEEYTPEGSDRTVVAEFIEADRIFFNSGGKKSDSSSSSSSGSSSSGRRGGASESSAPAASEPEEDLPGGGIGAGVLDL